VLILLLGVTVVLYASDNSVEVTIEDTQPQTPPPHWKFRPDSAAQDSDPQGDKWRDKFITASDKPLGTAKDTSAIEALVPSSMPLTIRWISRSVALVSADCYSDARSGVRLRCLYVLKKRRSKWQVTHHYRHTGPLTFGLTMRSSQPLTGKKICT